MQKMGHADLRLCTGPVPHYKEIVALGGALLRYMVEELGTKETLRRFADPLWFQAFACTVGFEWQFSGATTVTIRALMDSGAVENIHIVGGKGAQSKTIHLVPEDFRDVDRLTAKIDNSAVQDGYSLYFHAVLFDDEGHWTIINQGMNIEERLARRYHWCWEVNRFLDNAQSIAGSRVSIALDLSSGENRELRKTIMDILSDESPRSIVYKIMALSRPRGQKSILEYTDSGADVVCVPYHLRIPRKVREDVIRIAKGASSFLDLLKTPGLGASTLRGLAYIAALVYGAPISWKDPVKYTFAFGTKAGIPWMVERATMRKAANFLISAIEEAKIGKKAKVRAIKRLSKILPVQ